MRCSYIYRSAFKCNSKNNDKTHCHELFHSMLEKCVNHWYSRPIGWISKCFVSRNDRKRRQFTGQALRQFSPVRVTGPAKVVQTVGTVQYNRVHPSSAYSS